MIDVTIRRWRVMVAMGVVLAGLSVVAMGQTEGGRLTGPRLASEQPAASEAAAPQPPAAPASAGAAQEPSLSFLNLLTKGGWAMWPLAACSLLGLALIIERGLAPAAEPDPAG